jgi:hypothetical protein
MKTFLIAFSWTLVTAIATAEDKPVGVMFSTKVGDQTVPDSIIKPGETGAAKGLREVLSPKIEPPLPNLGWVVEITPVRDKANNLVGKIIIRNTTMKIDESESPLVTSTESIFRFSLPVDGAFHTKNLPGLGDVSLKLWLIDAFGNQIKAEQVSP